MKKLAVITLLMSAQMSLASVTDFHSLIVENNQAQNELHDQIKNSIETARVAVQEGSKTFSVASETAVPVKTNKEFLRFDKEKRHFKASEDKNEKRLAEEILISE